MSTAKELLEAATPLPWETDEVHGETCIRNEDGEAVVPWTGLTDDINYRFIVYAVNRLPAYEAAVEALDRIVHHFNRDAIDEAILILGRLRDEVPA